MDEGFIIKLVGLIKRNIKCETARSFAYQEVIGFLKEFNLDIQTARGMDKVYDKLLLKNKRKN